MTWTFAEDATDHQLVEFLDRAPNGAQFRATIVKPKWHSIEWLDTLTRHPRLTSLTLVVPSRGLDAVRFVEWALWKRLDPDGAAAEHKITVLINEEVVSKTCMSMCACRSAASATTLVSVGFLETYKWTTYTDTASVVLREIDDRAAKGVMPWALDMDAISRLFLSVPRTDWQHGAAFGVIDSDIDYAGLERKEVVIAYVTVVIISGCKVASLYVNISDDDNITTVDITFHNGDTVAITVADNPTIDYSSSAGFDVSLVALPVYDPLMTLATFLRDAILRSDAERGHL